MILGNFAKHCLFCKYFSTMGINERTFSFILGINNCLFSDLSFNKMQSIQAQTFSGLAPLQKLFLSNNEISYIEENAFIHLPHLKVL